MKYYKNIFNFIHSDPDIVSGVPVFTGTRVSVQALFECLKRSTLDEFKAGFPDVTNEQIQEVLTFAGQNLIRTLFPFLCEETE